MNIPFEGRKGLCGITTILGENRVVNLIPGACLPGCKRFCRRHRFTSNLNYLRCISVRKGEIPFKASVLFVYRRRPRLITTTRVYRSL